ncbi:hypothetical protein D3C85_1480150 [compost metagenome]
MQAIHPKIPTYRCELGAVQNIDENQHRCRPVIRHDRRIGSRRNRSGCDQGWYASNIDEGSGRCFGFRALTGLFENPVDGLLEPLFDFN